MRGDAGAPGVPDEALAGVGPRDAHVRSGRATTVRDVRSSWRALLRAVAVVTVLVAAACTQDAGDADSTPPAEGTGHLMAGYLRTPADEGRFSGDPVPVQAELLVLGNGCVAVVVDAVERLPIWPDGTSVVQDPDDLDRYVVPCPAGRSSWRRPPEATSSRPTG